MARKILGIETSCDETAVAIIDENYEILANVINSQVEIHKQFGGVVPEVAARSHIEFLDEILNQALNEAKIKLEEIDAIAVTSGPGLIGGLIVGVVFAKTLALALKKPLFEVNHLEAHLLTPLLNFELNFPYLTILLSGGHCQILEARNFGDYKLIGQTIDDALGESFDKVALMLGFSYPGGPKIEKAAAFGDENRFRFPKPLCAVDQIENRFNFSFSGLKTAVRREIENLAGEEFSHLTKTHEKLSEQEKNDICASFQKTVCEILKNRLRNIFENYDFDAKPEKIILAGGVAANKYIFGKLQDFACEFSCELVAPPLKLCTDNAAMIALVGLEKLKRNCVVDFEFKPKARWSLENSQ